MAQTSVEWLFYAMQKTPMTEWYKVLEQAKEKHKQEIIEAFKHGELPPLFVSLNALDYYNETFK